MKFIEKSGEIINTLIKVNMDRVAGFEHAEKELKENDVDLKKIFKEYKEESRNYIKELRTEANKIDAKNAVIFHKNNAIQRTWRDVKAIFDKNDRQSILKECERCEYAVKKAYRDIFASASSLSVDLMQLLSTQEVGIFIAHDNIRILSESQA